MGANSYDCRSYRGKTSKEGTLFPPIMNRVKHDNCIVKLSLMPTSLIIVNLTTLKNFTTRESFWCNYVYLWQNCLYALLTNTSLFCSMFGINDAWLFVMTICHKGVTCTQKLDIMTMLQLFKSGQKGGTEIVKACNSWDFVIALFLLWEWNYLITW